jgi:predicted transcriptional regulator
VRRTVSIEQKTAWLRDANGGTVSPLAEALSTRYYSVKEIADLLNLSQDCVRKLFQSEAGVLVLGDQSSKYKRRYTTLRIPESVLRRVLRRMSNV